MNTPTAMGNTIFHKLSSVRAIGPAGSIALCGSPLVAQPARTTASNTIHASQRRRLAAAVGPVAADLIGVGSRGCAAALKLPLIAELRGSWFRETRGGPASPARNARGSWFRETRGGPASPAGNLRGSWFRETRGGPSAK